MEKKKVLILITKSNWGGAQRYVFDIANNLSKDTFDVQVMAGSEGLLLEKLRSVGIQANGNLSIGRDINILSDIKAFFELISILRKNRPDILHLNSSKIGGLGALAGRIARVQKIIFTAHGWAFNENRSYISKLIIKIIHWITVILCHKTISVSENLKNQIDTLPYTSNKITVIHNAIKTEPIFSKIHADQELSKINSDLKQKFEVMDPKKTLIIGSIGELHHIKGYEYALRGISEIIKDKKNKIVNLLYIIIGTGEEKDRINNLINELGLQQNVIMLGYIKDAYQYMKTFDVFLLPSLSESFGYVLLEAGLSSIATVATAVGGVPEIIDDMKNGILIQPKKPLEIKSAIEFYLANKKTRKEHGIALNEKVKNEFSIEKMINETVKVYNP